MCRGFPGVTYEWLFKTIFCTDQNLCLLGDMSNKQADASPVSLTNGLFNTIFYIDLKLCLPGNLSNECAEASQVLPISGPFQDHHLSKTIILIQSSVFWKTWTMNVQSQVFPTSLMNGLFKTIFPIYLKLGLWNSYTMTIERLPQSHPPNGHFKTIFQV